LHTCGCAITLAKIWPSTPAATRSVSTPLFSWRRHSHRGYTHQVAATTAAAAAADESATATPPPHHHQRRGALDLAAALERGSGGRQLRVQLLLLGRHHRQRGRRRHPLQCRRGARASASATPRGFHYI
jgi:hypothetical protein